MNAIEIPEGDWKHFLDGFTNQHHDWLVNLTFEEPDASKIDVRDAVLENVELAAGDHPGLVLEVGRKDGGHTRFEVRDMHRMRVLRDEDGADSALSVESGEGTRLLMHFISPQPVEAVDGVLHPGEHPVR
jgi:hypothetical protein